MVKSDHDRRSRYLSPSSGSVPDTGPHFRHKTRKRWADARLRHDIVWRGGRARMRRWLPLRRRGLAALGGVSTAAQAFSALAYGEADRR